MMRWKSPLPELIFRENQVEQLFVFLKDNFEMEMPLKFANLIHNYYLNNVLQ